jgi:isopentenyldiphosphate isomerase
MKVAILWLINEQGEILMARRAAHMSTDAGVWGPSVSGGVDEGESYENAAVREAHEELGIAISTISPVFLHQETYLNHSDGAAREFGLFYARVPKDIVTQFQLEPDEVSEVRWFSIDELKSLAREQSKTLIISSASDLWARIFSNLAPLVASKDS